LIKRVASLESRVELTLVLGPDAVIAADTDQLEQMLINLLRNAADGVIEYRASQGGSNALDNLGAQVEPPIVLTWSVDEKTIVIIIEDRGIGLVNPGNAFVPFYTTKQSGSGIGLILSRQVCEAHGGSLELANCSGHRGCVARVILPKTSNVRTPST
jgi:signal transduction histidine kinase